MGLYYVYCKDKTPEASIAEMETLGGRRGTIVEGCKTPAVTIIIPFTVSFLNIMRAGYSPSLIGYVTHP